MSSAVGLGGGRPWGASGSVIRGEGESALKGLVIYGQQTVRLEQVLKPQVRPGWVLVKIKASGICGSDLHFYHQTPAELGPRYGVVIGHEPAGVVEEVGAGVTAVRPGDRVSVYHYLSCGHCHACRSGHRQLCPERVGIAAAGYGSSAEYLLAPEANCLPLPDALSFVDGALMACCAGTAFSALDKLGASGRDSLVIYGLGPVGLSALLEAVALGVRVIGVELVPERLQLGRALGADLVIDAGSQDPVEAVLEATDGEGADLALETSGAASARSQIVRTLRWRGKAAFVGLGSGAPAIAPEDLIDSERVVMGSYVLPLGLFKPLADFLVRKQVRLERLVTHRFPIERGEEAFAFSDQQRSGKVVLEYS